MSIFILLLSSYCYPLSYCHHTLARQHTASAFRLSCCKKFPKGKLVFSCKNEHTSLPDVITVTILCYPVVKCRLSNWQIVSNNRHDVNMNETRITILQRATPAQQNKKFQPELKDVQRCQCIEGCTSEAVGGKSVLRLSTELLSISGAWHTLTTCFTEMSFWHTSNSRRKGLQSWYTIITGFNIRLMINAILALQ